MGYADKIAAWAKEYMDAAGPNSKAIVGISGGKDSSIVAALLVRAIGKERVIGVMMPDGYQRDQDKARELISFLGIKAYDINIRGITEASRKSIEKAYGVDEVELTYCMQSNMPARVRMMTLYNVAAMEGNARVANTCNASEDYVGYSTKFGDAAGDFSLLSDMLVSEVKQIGYELGLPKDLIEKAPEDGLSGKTDEDSLGFTYAELDEYIKTGGGVSEEKAKKIEELHKKNLHKLLPMPTFRKETTAQ